VVRPTFAEACNLRVVDPTPTASIKSKLTLLLVNGDWIIPSIWIKVLFSGFIVLNECSVPVPRLLILKAVVDVDNPATLNLLLSNLENTNNSGGMRLVDDPPMTWFVASIPTLVFPWLSYLILSPAWNPWLNIVIVSELTVILLLSEALGLNILLNKGTTPLCDVSLNELNPTIWPPTIGVLITTVKVVALITVTVKSTPEAGSLARGYGCSVV